MTDARTVKAKRLVVPPALYTSLAFNALRPVARLLFDTMARMASEIKGDGWIGLSERQASAALNVARETASKAFIELEAYRFIIRLERGYRKGRQKVASQWRLTCFPFKGEPATHDYDSPAVVRKVWKESDDKLKRRRIAELEGVKFMTPDLEIEIRPRKRHFDDDDCPFGVDFDDGTVLA